MADGRWQMSGGGVETQGLVPLMHLAGPTPQARSLALLPHFPHFWTLKACNSPPMAIELILSYFSGSFAWHMPSYATSLTSLKVLNPPRICLLDPKAETQDSKQTMQKRRPASVDA